MKNETMMAIKPEMYTLNKKDIGPLLQRLQMKTEAGSPLQAFEQAATTDQPGEEATALLHDKTFIAALTVMSMPQRVIRIYAGGGMQSRGDLFACYQPGKTVAPLVAITPSLDDSWVMLVFPETEQGIGWLLDTIGTRIEEAPLSPFAETFTAEFLVYLFGTIDQYRRCSYENMLQHRSGETTPFTLAEFAGNIKTSLQSKDMRWALPALMGLMPGLAELPLKEDTEVYYQLIDADVMLPVESSNGKMKFMFGEVGKDLGTEFLRSWVQSAGIEVSGISNGNMITEHRAFVAGTMLANHLFELLPGSNVKQEIQYAPLSRNELGELLEKWVIAETGSAGTTGVVEKKKETVSQESTTEQVTKRLFCAHCGEPIRQGTQFCAKCGKPVK